MAVWFFSVMENLFYVFFKKWFIIAARLLLLLQAKGDAGSIRNQFLIEPMQSNLYKPGPV